MFRRMTDTRSYVLISPCRDEAQYMRQTLDSVIGQSIRPTKWIIVDDGSTDETPSILAEYEKKYSWINPKEFEYLCKLDLDLRLPPTYFEILIQKMKANSRIATCSGKAYVET